MTTKKKPNRRFMIIIIIAIILLMTTGISYYCLELPPQDEADALQLLYLREDVTPVFRLESQLTYTPDLLTRIHTALGEIQVGTQVGDGSHHTSTQNNSSPSFNVGKGELSPYEVINLRLYIASDVSTSSTLIDDLYHLLDYSEHLKVSLIPDETISDNAYIDYCMTLVDTVNESHADKIEFIWYPTSSSALKKFDIDKIDNIGIVLNSTDDLNKLSSIYEYFSETKNIYIQDNITLTSKKSVNLTVEQINTVYYILAIKYPNIGTIFTPYLNKPFNMEDSFSFRSDTTNVERYNTIYKRLRDEPWITTKSIKLSSVSPYLNLEPYTTLNGTVELILSPNSTILGAGNSLRYRYNETSLKSQDYYPYLTSLDTTQFSNGINRLKAVASKDNTQTKVESIDINITNPITETKSPRKTTSYSLESKPIYPGKYIPILMYHTVADAVAKEDENSCVETSVFEAQIKGLLEAGYTPINFKMLLDYNNNLCGLPEKPVLITMDDGYINNFTNAYPIYKKYNVQATLFVSSYFMKDENTERHFGWNAAKEMEESGLIDIQSHGYDHTPFPYMSLKKLKYQISHSKGLIEQHLGKRDVFVVACPEFRNTRYTRDLLNSIGVDFQITNLAKEGTVPTATSLKRINVPNTMTPDELVAKIESLTN